MTDLGDKAKERFLRETKPPEVEGVKIDWSPLPHPSMRDLRGMRFGKLIVKAHSYTREQANGIPCVYWKCQCDCGEETEVSRDHLVRQGTKSCGCLSVVGKKGRDAAQKVMQKRSHYIKRMRHGLPPVPPTEVIGNPAHVFAYDSLMAYACLQWAGYIPAAHHHLIARYLEKVEKGKIKRLMIFLPPRHGKLCADSTPVMTPEGWKTHGELKVGDYVYGLDGRPVAVLAVSEKQPANMLVMFSNSDTIKCHENHEWGVMVELDSGKTLYEVSETKDIKKGLDHGGRYKLPESPATLSLSQVEIILIMECDPEMGHCIQVDSPDGLYLAGRTHIPTHNSMIISEYFPAWYLGRNPDKRLIATSYGQELASDFGRKVRNQIADPMYSEIFPGVALSGDSAAADKFDLSPPHRGGYFAVGAGGAITGRGANCFSGETLILTEAGAIDIATLVKLEYRPRVLSFNHDKNLLEYRRILAVQESVANELVEIRTLGKRSVRVTRDHVVYDSQRGYRAAEVFKSGDGLVSCEIPVKQDLREVWDTKGGTRVFVQKMLQRSKESVCSIEVCKMWDRVFKTTLRVRKAIKERSCRFLLLCEMLSRASCDKKSPSLQNLQQSSGEKRQTVLQRVSAKITREKSGVSAFKDYLPNVQYGIYGKVARAWAGEVCAILQQALFGNWPFSKNAWRREPALDSWSNSFTETAALCASVPNHASFDFKKRQQYVHSLWRKSEEAPRSSFRRETNKQSIVKFGGTLRELPWTTPCIDGLRTGYDEVESIVRVCETATVYDIQVEANHNLFANGILCHNCIIIDDILKNSEEADSETHRRKLIDWYTSTAYTRLMDDGAIVLVMTRWHVSDLAGHLLKEHKHEKWTVLNLPAINEKGEALWPERYPLDVLAQIKKTLPARHWESLYQQQPFIEEGGIFKRQWWKLWPDTKPIPECEFIIQSYDTAYSDKDLKSNSFSARTTWGVFKRPDDECHNLILLESWKARVEYADLRKEAVRAYLDYQPDKVIIEKKASGQALVSDLRRAGLPIATYTPTKDKITRAYIAQALFENGRVYYPSRQWAEEAITNLCQFPQGSDDDLVDTVSMAFIWLQQSFLVSHSEDAKRRQREEELENDDDLPDNVTRLKFKKKKRAVYG